MGKHPAYTIIDNEICRQDVPGGRWETIDRAEAEALLEQAISASRDRAAQTAEILEQTGMKTAEEVIDMANLGVSLLNAIETITSLEGPFKGWAPAENPAEIVGDLYARLDEQEA